MNVKPLSEADIFDGGCEYAPDGITIHILKELFIVVFAELDEYEREILREYFGPLTPKK